MWPWRDWVIRAYNDNKRFDEFTVEQLAGDQFENASLDHKVASGFNRNHGTTDEGGLIEEEYRVEYKRRSRQDNLECLAGLDDGMRPVPRPQV